MLMRTFLTLSLTLTLLTGAACHKNLTPATPRTAATLTANDVGVRVNELQAALIQACGPTTECQPGAGFSTATFNQAVKSLISVRNALRDVPSGWKLTVRDIWLTEVKPRLAAIANPVIIAALAAADALVLALTQGV